LPYIERFIKTNDSIMYIMAAYLSGKIGCSADNKIVLEKIEHWFQDNKEFVQEVLKHMLQVCKQKSRKDPVVNAEEIIKWINEKFGKEIDIKSFK